MASARRAMEAARATESEVEYSRTSGIDG
jgi:hypothetical protein